MRRVLAICVGLTGVALAVNLWPEPPMPALPEPIHAVGAPNARAGAELASAIAATRALETRHPRRDVVAALKPDGPPGEADRGAWRPYVAAIDALDVSLWGEGLSLVDDPEIGEPRLTTLRTLIPALCLRAWDEALAGDVEAAIARLGAGMSLTTRLLDSAQYSAVAVEAGVARQHILRELAEVLGWVITPEVDRAALALLLAHPPGIAEALARGWPEECRHDELHHLDTSASRIAEALDLDGVHIWVGLPAALVDPVLVGVLVDREEARRKHRERCRELAEELARPPGLRNPPPPHFESGSTDPLDYLGAPTSILADDVTTPILERMRYAEETDAAHAVLITFLAARLRRAETGRAGGTVDDLVPRWLAAVPRDAWGPIRMDSARVWSLGEPEAGTRRPALAYDVE